MKRYLIATAVLAASAVIYTSASDGTKTSAPEFKLDLFYNSLGRPQLQVTSLNDAVTIKKILINRGKCAAVGPYGVDRTFPVSLKYSQRSQFSLIPGTCNLLEATVFTDQGEAAYTFQ
ncbi:hypothetical protein ACW5XW_22240 [Aeromonas piscicola]|uniref:hypothetical protein n=1 Tax=Aeromonas piscicola TaxID=600645 RepID=UPI00069344AE|nr:hypothetical protein [Aeromonas piscicola]